MLYTFSISAEVSALGCVCCLPWGFVARQSVAKENHWKSEDLLRGARVVPSIHSKETTPVILCSLGLTLFNISCDTRHRVVFESPFKIPDQTHHLVTEGLRLPQCKIAWP